ncbi:MAG: ABC transporter permease [bacterium]|nr:ABC transporter permease [bacterium]
MEFSELISEAVSALTRNKMRTGLATLGIVIGISAVITLVSLGQSSQKTIENQIQSLGSNLLTVIPGAQTSGGIRGAGGAQTTTLTYEDAKAIETAHIQGVQAISPELARRTQLIAGRNNTNVQAQGVTSTYASVHAVTVQNGTFLTDQDVTTVRKVAVVGPQVVTDLFGENASPVGQTIRINKQTFTIIGITTPKGGTGFQNQDNMVFIPLTTAQKIVFGVDPLSSIVVQTTDANVMTDVQNDVGYFLLSRHKLDDPTEADFSILSQQDILGAANQVTGIFTTLLAGIAAISLLVGGIGIMNIMLVTVIERTREIGLRKALGAKKNIVVSQFLAESIILTVMGGIIGVVLGILLSFTITHFMNLPFTISLFSLVLACGVSGIIGIVFGWYPARQAANLSPIEALRYE